MFNIVSYILFLAISSYITVDVGRRCYHAGKYYLEYLIHDSDVCRTINKILLGCYYLLNLGYIAVSLTSWDRVGRNYNRNRHPDRKHLTDSLCFTLHEHLCTLFFKEKFNQKINLL
jgi:hypothetical protein